MIRRPPKSTLFPSPPLFRSTLVTLERSAGTLAPVTFSTKTLTLARRAPSAERLDRAKKMAAATPGKEGVDPADWTFAKERSEEHTSELQSRLHLVCRLLLEK